jgi:hypothetical protein
VECPFSPVFFANAQYASRACPRGTLLLSATVRDRCRAIPIFAEGPHKSPHTDLIDPRARSPASQTGSQCSVRASRIVCRWSESMQHEDLLLCCTVAGEYPPPSEDRLLFVSAYRHGALIPMQLRTFARRTEDPRSSRASEASHPRLKYRTREKSTQDELPLACPAFRVPSLAGGQHPDELSVLPQSLFSLTLCRILFSSVRTFLRQTLFKKGSHSPLRINLQLRDERSALGRVVACLLEAILLTKLIED